MSFYTVWWKHSEDQQQVSQGDNCSPQQGDSGGSTAVGLQSYRSPEKTRPYPISCKNGMWLFKF